ncbi:oxygen-dependent tRNA uridine(34) hydroxylase TrhO [Alkaliflexus imshenetskii]|uniref:oxygen-dependent tRNA uridine(34) hydroxylase TrhO n=1 Tax=Alkaliflexus imshenetskii TaxID=286730 RepID=UPI0004B90585|nr:rhodanese-related sulfurtransferase [Alkaliflexus imshenetskii]
MQLHNKLSKQELLARLNSETFKRRTLSFYRYINIENPQQFRDDLYLALNSMNCNGRIYVASEGINAQMNLPEHNVEQFLGYLDSVKELANMPIKWAIEDGGASFLKLIVRVRPKIVADGLIDQVFDTTNVGNHLSPVEFHQLMDEKDVIVVDMRNNYESEVGRFVNAICPDAETFRDEVEMVVDQLANEKDKKILLYCTGGVRCEKASAWMRHHGFKDVNQLHGGIIAYVSEIRQKGLDSKFIGKNFVFDERLGERVTHHVIAKCHQCGKPCDTHVNCAYDPCHDLIIQCSDCAEKYSGCCSAACHHNLQNNPKQRSVNPVKQPRNHSACAL